MFPPKSLVAQGPLTTVIPHHLRRTSMFRQLARVLHMPYLLFPPQCLQSLIIAKMLLSSLLKNPIILCFLSAVVILSTCLFIQKATGCSGPQKLDKKEVLLRGG